MFAHPEAATFLGIHTEDHWFGEASRDAVLGDLEGERAHLAALEAIDPEGLSPDARSILSESIGEVVIAPIHRRRTAASHTSSR